MTVQQQQLEKQQDQQVINAVDEAKLKRIISNRESARRSRKRKQQQIEQLTINGRKKDFIISVLRTHIMGLQDVIMSKDAMIQTLKEVTGLTVDAPESDTDDKLHLQMLMDVCLSATGIPDHLIAPLVKEYNKGSAADVPKIPDHLLEMWKRIEVVGKAFQL